MMFRVSSFKEFGEFEECSLKRYHELAAAAATEKGFNSKAISNLIDLST